jgi:hypothetical protein
MRSNRVIGRIVLALAAGIILATTTAGAASAAGGSAAPAATIASQASTAQPPAASHATTARHYARTARTASIYWPPCPVTYHFHNWYPDKWVCMSQGRAGVAAGWWSNYVCHYDALVGGDTWALCVTDY